MRVSSTDFLRSSMFADGLSKVTVSMLVTGSAIAWSTAGWFTRLIGLDSWTILFWRGIFAAIGILVFMLAMDGKDECTADVLRLEGARRWVAGSPDGFQTLIEALRSESVKRPNR